MPTTNPITALILAAAEAAEQRNDLGAAHALREVAERVKAEEPALCERANQAEIERDAVMTCSTCCDHRIVLGLLDEARGQVAVLNKRLIEARDAIASLPQDALGSGRSPEMLPTGEAAVMEWPIRDEMLHYINRDLNSTKPSAEAFLAEVRKREYDKWQECLDYHRTALDMIRHALEEIGPVGTLPSVEATLPDPRTEAAAIIEGIQKALRAERDKVREECAAKLLDPSGGETWASKIILATREGTPPAIQPNEKGT